MRDPIVIIGAGQAGAKVAETLRKLSIDRPIVMFGDEEYFPYQRPPLSKKFLLGEVPESQLMLNAQEFYSKNDIEVITGRRAVRLDPDRRSVVFQDESEFSFCKLVIATGSSPRRLSVPGCDCDGVVSLRSIADVLAMRERLPAAEKVVIIGAGYLGLEAAAVLTGMGKAVTVLEAEERILKRVAGVEIAEYLTNLHQAHGVDIRSGACVASITGEKCVSSIVLRDGEQLAADLVLIAVGGVANDEFSRQSGLACDDGILVDNTGSTSWPGVYAAGDCARFYSRRYDRSIRLESVQNANDQARAVAEHIAGGSSDYDPVPWFWSDQYDTKLQIAGLGYGHDKTVVQGEPDSHSFSVEYYRGDKLLAVDAINDGKSYMRGRKALTLGEAASEKSRPAARVASH